MEFFTSTVDPAYAEFSIVVMGLVGLVLSSLTTLVKKFIPQINSLTILIVLCLVGGSVYGVVMFTGLKDVALAISQWALMSFAAASTIYQVFIKNGIMNVLTGTPTNKEDCDTQ